MSEHKVFHRSNSQTAARQTLAFLALAYILYIPAAMIAIGDALVMQYGVEGATESDIFLAWSLIYFGFALTAVPHVWYMYHVVKQNRGKKGIGVTVGVIVPTLVGYLIFVLGHLFELYQYTLYSTEDSLLLSFLESAWGISLLLGPIYIPIFYLFAGRGPSNSHKSQAKTETKTPPTENDTTGEKVSGTAQGNSEISKGLSVHLGSSFWDTVFLSRTSRFFPRSFPIL